MSQARQASRESSIVQQPRLPVRRVPGIRDSARWTPTTSCPASTARAAATAESTPPLMAARTRILAFSRVRGGTGSGDADRSCGAAGLLLPGFHYWFSLLALTAVLLLASGNSTMPAPPFYRHAE